MQCLKYAYCTIAIKHLWNFQGPSKGFVSFFIFEGGNNYEEFLGIPFAAPPVRDLRWRRPIPPNPWQGVRRATSFSRQCTQSAEIRASEDCLYLNVYVPGGTENLA